MYHYIKNLKDFPKNGYLDLNNFKKQINLFKNNYKIQDPFEFINDIRSKKILNKKNILLTFDDGLKCHHDYVLPYLLKNNLKGIFFIPTKVLEEKKLLKVHKIHILLSLNKIKDILFAIEKHIIENKNNKFVYKSLTYDNQNNEKTKFIKNYLNYELDSDLSEDFVNFLFRKFSNFDEKKIFEKYYLNYEEIIKMSKSGMLIGSHSHSHKLLSKENKSNLEKDISKSIRIIKEINKILTFCYPYGGKISYDNRVIDILKKRKVDLAFSVENREIKKNDVENKYLELPRHDCNYFKYGKAN